MSLWKLIIKEIRLRKINFALAIVSVLGAVGILTAAVTLLESHDLRTQQILDATQQELEGHYAKNEDEYRKIMKKLGFNLLLLPEGQRLDDFYADGYATLDMPERYATTLANSGMMTIRHLLPTLEQKIRWPEQGHRQIILIGTRGEFPLGHREIEEPMMVAVPPGKAVLGREIWDSLGLKTGDAITLLGNEFTVSTCHPERGNKDDVTIWIDLVKAQEILGKKGRINAILALKCFCKGADLPTIRKDIAGILPGVKILELHSKVLVRAEAREQARITTLASLEMERKNREKLRTEREAFAAWLVPVVTLGAIVWIGALAYMNVRERKAEIGILRALGLSSLQIMTVFLGKALVVGIVGAAIGYGVGFAIGLHSGEIAVNTETAGTLFNPVLLIVVLIAAPLLTVFASWPPALLASRQDPALVVRDN